MSIFKSPYTKHYPYTVVLVCLHNKMATFSEQAFQEKLSRLTSSQDSIETLSLWIIHHRAHAVTEVSIWLEYFLQGEPLSKQINIYLPLRFSSQSGEKTTDAVPHQ